MTDDEDRGARAAAERELKRYSRIEELEAKVVELEQCVPLLTERLEQRTAALDRVVAEKEAFREALVRILSLEGVRIDVGGEDVSDPMLPVEAVHDAVGHDLIGYLMYRQRWIVGIPKPEGDTLPLDWDDPEPKTLTGVADALEKIRHDSDLRDVLAAPDDKLKPFDKVRGRRALLETLGEHVGELARTYSDRVFGTYEASQDRPIDMPEPLPHCSCMHGFDGADGPKIVRRDAACPIHGQDR